jgi:hypothetical protein
MPVYRYLNKGGHRALNDEQACAKATEIHHKPGDGVTKEMFKSILEPAGFEVRFYPHNGTVGKEIMNGLPGKKPSNTKLHKFFPALIRI